MGATLLSIGRVAFVLTGFIYHMISSSFLKRAHTFILILLGFFALLGSVWVTLVFLGGDALDHANTASISRVSRPTSSSEADRTVQLDRKIGRMFLVEKIGQMMMVGLPGIKIDEGTRTMIRHYGVGGFNLLGKNVKNEDQVRTLIGNLQREATIPLFIATDQEGARVVRFPFLGELTPQRKISTAEDAEQVAIARGIELQALGVNMNFSPVAECVTRPTAYLYERTFAASCDDVPFFAEAMVRGYLLTGIIPVVKHFPGYGSSSDDPHGKSVILPLDEKETEEFLFPFRALFSGTNIPAVMTAHVIIPSFDRKPATRSTIFLEKVLRREWGYEGVIITDDLEMASVGVPPVQAAIEAIEAGADMIVSTPNPAVAEEIIRALVQEVRAGRVPESRIDESVQRILTFKNQYLIKEK